MSQATDWLLDNLARASSETNYGITYVISILCHFNAMAECRAWGLTTQGETRENVSDFGSMPQIEKGLLAYSLCPWVSSKQDLRVSSNQIHKIE